MAEVILPPIDTEPELPEEQLPEVEKPTEKSKVISVNFNPLNTKQTASLDTRESFYTTDTDAWIVLNVGDMNEPTGQYSLALINKEDGSIFQRTGDIVQGVAYYKLLPNEIKHAGRWVGQAVITLANGQTTASRFSFNVSGHILDGKDVREIVIQDFQTLMKQLNDLKDNSTNEFGLLKSEIEAFQTIVQASEDERQATELERVAAEIMREENYESKVTAAIVEADVVEKVDNKVAELTPTIQQVTAQLAQTMTQTEFDSWVATLLDGGPSIFFDTFNALNTAYPNGSDGVALVRETDPAKIYVWNGSIWEDFGSYQGMELKNDSITTEKYRENSVTPEKTSFIRQSDNLVDPSKVLENMVVNATGVLTPSKNYNTFDFGECQPLETFSIKGFVYVAQYDFSHNFISRTGILPAGRTFSLSDNTYYIRLSWEFTTVQEKQQINRGKNLLPYDEFEQKIFDASINDMINKPVEYPFDQSNNLFNPKDVLENVNGNTAGELVSSTSYNTFDFGECQPLETFSIKGFLFLYEYDATRSFIGRRTLDPAGQTFSLSDNTYYIRLSWEFTTVQERQQMNRGWNLLSYDEFEQKIYGIPVNDMINEPESNNLFDPNKVISRANYSPDDGSLIVSTTYNATPYYKVNVNESYTFRGFTWYALYDSNKNFIRRSAVGTNETGLTYTVEEGVNYIAFSWDSASTVYPQQINKGKTLLAYDELESDTKPVHLIGNQHWSNFFVPGQVPAHLDVNSYKVADVYGMYDSLILKYPNNFSKEVIGLDASGEYDMLEITYRPLKPLSPKVKLLLEINIHGNENGGDQNDSTVAFYELLKMMMESSNEALNLIRFNAEIKFIPIANPWGFDNSRRGNVNGVDLNRQFQQDTAPLESESIVIKNFIERNTDAVAYYAVHNYGFQNMANGFESMYSYAEPLIFSQSVREVALYTKNSAQTDASSRPQDKTGNYTTVRFSGNKGIPAATLEWPTSGTIHGAHTSQSFTHYVEYLGNMLYRYLLRLI